MKTSIYCRVGNKEQVVENSELNKIREQILSIRDTGLTNMFDLRMVQKIAFDMEFWELIFFLEDHKDKYVRFIMSGEM